MKLNTYRRTGAFTLVEIMIVVAIIGLLAAIAIPNFVRARETSQTNACVNNLRQIDAAKDQWALENGKTTDDDVTMSDILPYLSRKREPKCPVGETPYVLTTVGAPAECNSTKKIDHNKAYTGSNAGDESDDESNSG